MRKITRLAILILAVILAYNFQFDIYFAEAGIITISESDDLNKVIDDLRPGYTLIVEPGVYRLPYWSINDLRGTAEAPITIKAKEGAIIEGFSRAFSVVRMKNSSHIVFQGFEIRSSAQTLGGIDGIRITGESAHNIDLKDLEIHDVSGRGIRVAADKVFSLNISGCEIYDCRATALELGYPGKYTVHNSSIKGNYIHNCPKDANRRGYYGIRVRGGSFANVIEDNVLHDTGSYNKAGITVYYGRSHKPGDSMDDANVVRNNILWNSRNQGIAAISDAVIENNTVFNTDIGIALMAYFHNSSLEEGKIENLIVRDNSVFNSSKACVHIYDWSETGFKVEFSHNLTYQASDDGQAIKGSAGNAIFKDNIYHGTSDVVKGVSLASKDIEISKILALTKEPDIDMSKSLRSSLSEAVSEAKKMAQPENKKNKLNKPVLKNNVEEVTLADAQEVFNHSKSVDMNSGEVSIYDYLIEKVGRDIKNKNKTSLARFIKEGTLTTEYLGAGERGGVLDSYLSAFGKLPKIEKEWQDVIKIANGRWPAERNPELEKKIKEDVFMKIYKREPKKDKPRDQAAVTIISYGLRPAERNRTSEKQAINTFENIYGRGPSKAIDWNIVRAIAYSGAKR